MQPALVGRCAGCVRDNRLRHIDKRRLHRFLSKSELCEAKSDQIGRPTRASQECEQPSMSLSGIHELALINHSSTDTGDNTRIYGRYPAISYHREFGAKSTAELLMVRKCVPGFLGSVPSSDCERDALVQPCDRWIRDPRDARVRSRVLAKPKAVRQPNAGGLGCSFLLMLMCKRGRHECNHHVCHGRSRF